MRWRQSLLRTKITGVEATKERLRVTFEGVKAAEPQMYNRVFIAVGCAPSDKLLNAEAAGVCVTDRGFINVGKRVAETPCRRYVDRRRLISGSTSSMTVSSAMAFASEVSSRVSRSSTLS